MPVAIGTKVHTGDICPITGIGRVPKVPALETPVVKGKVMPIYSGHDVTWELVLIV
jgi:hypothetical protein